MIKIAAVFFTFFLYYIGANGTETNQTQSNDTAQIEQLKFKSAINPDWENWKLRSYNYGLDTKKVPMPVFFDSQIATDSTIMVRGNNSWKKRWGLHVFEAYANDDTSRITMILNKHIEENLPVAELYYYASVYGMGLNAYNWFRIGSDVPFHSYMFTRDRAIFYGTVEMRNLFTLDNIGRDDLLDEQPPKDLKNYPLSQEGFKNKQDWHHARMGLYYKAEGKFLKNEALKKAKNGTIFYDKDRDIVVIKVGGKWKKLHLEELPDGVEY